MSADKLVYSPIAVGIYQGICVAGTLVPFYFPDKIFHYIIFVLFFGLGLKPFLEKTGLYDLYRQFAEKYLDWRYEAIIKRRTEETDQKNRNDKYRRSRKKDPRLPKNW